MRGPGDEDHFRLRPKTRPELLSTATVMEFERGLARIAATLRMIRTECKRRLVTGSGSSRRASCSSQRVARMRNGPADVMHVERVSFWSFERQRAVRALMRLAAFPGASLLNREGSWRSASGWVRGANPAMAVGHPGCFGTTQRARFHPRGRVRDEPPMKGVQFGSGADGRRRRGLGAGGGGVPARRGEESRGACGGGGEGAAGGWHLASHGSYGAPHPPWPGTAPRRAAARGPRTWPSALLRTSSIDPRRTAAGP